MATDWCQGRVWSASGQVRGWGSYVPCSKKATKDGFCGTHHPDAVAKREASVKARREEADRIQHAKWDRMTRDRNILAALERLTPDEVASLPASLRAILTPSDPRP